MHQVSTRRLVVGGVVAACCAAAAAAPASATTTVSVGDAQLVGKLVARVPVTLSCGPLDPFSLFGTVSLGQARGKEIAGGQASFAAGQAMLPTTSIVCDGTAQRLTVDVIPTTSGPPFKKGTAVAGATVNVSNTTFPFVTESASTGAVEMRIQ